MTSRRRKIYFDGGCRPNPGTMEIAVVAGGVAYIDRDAGQGSSMDAEWLALIAALRLARERGLADFVLLGDAAAVVAQANGTVRARGGAAAHLAVFRALAGDGPAPRVRHIKRTQNLAGIALTRALVEGKSRIGS
ncbi:ribonuclease HI [Sphingopyxis panaciterrae]|uniref:reverse transcriptase-like protein n=1 Tax=Sphingopyxis panaciterrae TaxID=363841 RepID=UPI00142467FD|nr:reverse transcriptase-like protein [Sphingopyxis panaciterrae]NIJ36077.1 ribonuclease HI [Sphingopyxis panaciterrae]